MGAIPWTPSADSRSFLPCDSNGDGVVDISDSVHSLRFLFASGDSGECELAADCNADGELNVSDAVYRLAHLFTDGPPPRAPYPACDAAPAAECAVTTCVR